MGHHVCPWWLGYFLLNPFRRRGQNPAKILGPYIREGMTVLEPGPGMGFFTLDLARMVGSSGRVIAVDIQEKMLSKLSRRVAKAGLSERVLTRRATAESMGIPDLAGSVDFTLAFAVVHEFPDPGRFFGEVAAASKSGASLLLAEPKGHVTDEEFAGELSAASQAGFRINEQPSIRRSQAALLKRA